MMILLLLVVGFFCALYPFARALDDAIAGKTRRRDDDRALNPEDDQ